MSRIVTNILPWFGYLFLTAPTVVVIIMAFGNKDSLTFPPTEMSTYLFEQYFFTSDWIEVTLRSARIALLAMFCALVLGIPAAYSLVRGNYPGRRFVTIILLSPILIPVVVVALGLLLYFSSLSLTGTELSIVAGHTVYTLPFVVVTAIAGLRHLDPNIEMAARIMGASELRIFLSVTLPNLRSSIISGGAFAFLMSFDEVIIAYFISGVNTTTLPVKMYHTIRWEIAPVLAAVSAILILVTVLISAGVAVSQKEGETA
ncbi:ABC transporter permease [Ruegeria atlantica]|uniref:ABC transporter permease n=1 Tax=Ruegeria atlantica TaxID=81569 RepID=UPI001C2BD0F4|nr:ABC transporter permease [Ruegeria atlantica]